MDWTVLLFFVTAAVLLVDLCLVLTKRPTISHRYQELFPTWVDIVFMVVVWMLIYVTPVKVFLQGMLWLLTGHIFFPNRELYKKREVKK